MVNNIKSFFDYLYEENSSAPHGVIFDGDKKVYIGAHHTKPIQLSNEIKTRVLNLKSKYGIWYEGNGGDIKPNVKLFGDKGSYEGSWDDEYAKTVKGYPIEFIVVMFANIKENKTVSHYTSANMTIFKSLLKNQEGKKYFKDRSYNEKDLTKFLMECSEKNVNFLEMSKMPATEENVTKFFTAGEKLTWPSNWEEYPNKAGKLAKKSEEMRNQFLLDRPSGVYVAGSGHLKELIMLDRSLDLIGGEQI